MTAGIPACASKVALRELRAEDAAFLYRVYASTRLQELAPLGWSEAQVEQFLRMQSDAQHNDYWSNYDTARFHIITSDEVDAGRLYVERRADELRIIDIALLPEFRGRGIGSMLISELFEEADAGGIAVRIHVEHNNPAQHLYLRLGFVFLEEDDSIYRLMERLPCAQRAEQAA